MRRIWPGVGEVCFELEAMGNEVWLTLTHSQLNGEGLILNVCTG